MPLEKPGFSRCSIGTSCSPVLRASDHGPVLDNPEGSLTVFAVGADHVFAVTELGEARALLSVKSQDLAPWRGRNPMGLLVRLFKLTRHTDAPASAVTSIPEEIQL